MTEIFRRILDLVGRREVMISDHGYEELAADGILVKDLFEGISGGTVAEEYPDYPKGPCVLILQRDRDGFPIHVLWASPPCRIACRRRHRLSARPESVDRGLFEEKALSARRHRTRFVHEGQFVAAVEVDWIEADAGWPPYLSLEDAQKLDEVREALRKGDLKRAGQLAKVYQLTPLAG